MRRVRAVVQRVSHACVRVEGQVVAEISAGLLVFVAVRRDENADAVAYTADKIANLRIFEDADGKMNQSLLDTKGQALVVSQFTLYGDVRRGRRPSFIDSAPPELAEPAYQEFLRQLARIGVPAQAGVFRADMQVELVNDGPVTILIDSDRIF